MRRNGPGSPLQTPGRSHVIAPPDRASGFSKLGGAQLVARAKPDALRAANPKAIKADKRSTAPAGNGMGATVAITTWPLRETVAAGNPVFGSGPNASAAPLLSKGNSKDRSLVVAWKP